MSYVDRDTEPRLERILSEIRAHAKQAARRSAPRAAERNFPAPTRFRGTHHHKEDAPVNQRSNRFLLGLTAALVACR